MKSLLKRIRTKKGYILLVFLSGVLLSGCKKHPVEPMPGITLADCPTLPPPKDPNIGYYIYTRHNSFNWPRYNPVNKDEFLCIEQNDSNYDNWLVVYNMITKKRKTLCLVHQYVQPAAWGAQGWIAFMGINGQLWKIRGNGDSMTQLTNERYAPVFPDWSPDGNKLAYINQTSSTDCTIRIIDKDGNYIKDIDSVGTFFNWSPITNKIATYSLPTSRHLPSGGNILLDINTKQYSVLKYRPESWFPDGDRYTTSDSNYFSICSHSTGVIKPFVRVCRLWDYDRFSINSDGTKMISRLISNKYMGDNKVLFTGSIAIMNADGTNVQEIDIPNREK